MLHAFFAGYFFSLSLILAIGAQNAFVLRQGISGRHLFLTCFICALSDAILIQIGIFGMQTMKTVLPSFAKIVQWGGVAFLLTYGILRLKAAYHGGESLNADGNATASRQKILLTTLAMTWLNPHVYLDTVLLIGNIAGQYPNHTTPFAIGATLASTSFFFALGYGAKALRKWLARPTIWRIIELTIGIFMLFLAAKLALETL